MEKNRTIQEARTCEMCGISPAIKWGMCDLCHIKHGTKRYVADLPYASVKN